MSISLRLLATLFVLACTFISCFSQTGCYIPVAGSAGGTEAKVYYMQQPGANTNPVRYYSVDYFYYENCVAGSTTHAVNQGNTTTPSTSCYVQYKGSGSYTNSGSYIQNGRLINYSIQQCPLDSNIVVMVLGLAGFVAVRRVLV